MTGERRSPWRALAECRTWLIVALVAGTLGAAPGDARSASPTMREKVYEKLSKAGALADAGNFDEAIELLRDVEKIRDLSGYEKAQLYTAYGFMHFSREGYSSAIESYEKVLAQEELPEALRLSTTYTLAQLLFQVESYQRAIDALETWLEMTPNPGPEPYILMGQAYYQLEKYREAIEPIETAISIAQQRERPVDENWYLLLRVFYYELEDFPKVLEILEILVRDFPKREYWIHLAAMYGESGDQDRQLVAYEIGYLQGFLERGEEFILLSQLLLQAEVPHRAGRILAEAMEAGIVEGTAENHRLLSQAWTRAQEDERAIAALTEAARLTSDGELDARLAHLYASNERWEEAIEAGRRALTKGIDEPDQVHILLGMALFELELYDDAKSAFREAQTLARGDPTASQWVNYIESEQERLVELRRSLE